MRIAVLIQSYNTYGCGPSITPLGDLLEARLGYYGPALDDIEIRLCVTLEALLATAFAAIKVDGCCSAEMKERALGAIPCELSPPLIERWRDAAARRSVLERMRTALEKAPEIP